MNLNTTSDDSSSDANDDSLDAFERQLRSLIPRPAQCRAPQQLPQLSRGTQVLLAATGPDDRDARRRQRGRGAMLLAAAWTLGAAAGVVGTLAWTGYWKRTESAPTIVQTNPINTTRQSNPIDPKYEMNKQSLRDVEQSASQTTLSKTVKEDQESIQPPETASQQRLVALFPWRQLQRADDGSILTPGSRSIVDAIVSPRYFHELPSSTAATRMQDPNASPTSPSTSRPVVISPRAIDIATPASQHKLRRDLLSDDRKIF